MATICRYCGAEALEYIGLDDGGGPYGESIEQMWRCLECNQTTAEVVDFADLDYDDPYTDPLEVKK